MAGIGMMVGIGIDGRAECEDDVRTGLGGGCWRANAQGSTTARPGLIGGCERPLGATLPEVRHLGVCYV